MFSFEFNIYFYGVVLFHSTNILTADVVEVNETTLELGCVRTRQYVTQLNSRFSEVLELNGCKKGTKKDQRICEEKNVKYWIASEICGEDKALYKISNEEERICDCKPGYIYHMDTKMCYKAHLRGPCNEGQVYVLNDDIGQCVMSECINHNEVPFKGNSNGQMIGVDPVTYEIKCISPPDDSKPGIYIPDLPNCPKGNKRDMKNKC
uniref:CSON009472 protein n=1 Tax=Culicoides sonorensis TaxID=179676 RepID=A0A336MXM3_CULSO